MRIVAAALLLTCAPLARADAVAAQGVPAGALATPAPASRPPYLPLRDEEDWRIMRDPAHRSDPLDALKFVPLGARDDQFLTLSGDIRMWDEHYVNQDWNAANGSNAYLLPRYLLGVDVHERRLHAFVQLESAAVAGRKGGDGTIYRDDFDPTDAYAAWRFGRLDAGPSSSAIVVGRQELDYGAGRIISARDGAGVRASFDGIRAILRSRAWRFDAFAMHPVTIGAGAFDDALDSRQALTGVYAVRTLAARTSVLEWYALDDLRKTAVLARGVAPETRYTVGARVGQGFGRLGTEFETSFQFGTFGSGARRAAIAAHAFAGNLSYRLGGGDLVTTLALGAGSGSGDDAPHSRIVRTFVPPSFRGSYFGGVSENGPPNSVGFEPSVTFAYRGRTTLTLADALLRVATSNDAIYNLAGFPLRRAAPGAAADIGSGPVITLTHAIDRHLTLTALYQRLNAGRHFDTAPPSAPITYNRYVAEYKF